LEGDSEPPSQFFSALLQRAGGKGLAVVENGYCNECRVNDAVERAWRSNHVTSVTLNLRPSDKYLNTGTTGSLTLTDNINASHFVLET
jgi:hypothetical protein